MSAWETIVDFDLPLTKEQADWAEALLDACAKGSLEDVPTELAEPVKRISSRWDAWDLEVEWTGDGLNVCSRAESAAFLIGWLQEILRRFEQITSLDYEWLERTHRDSGTYLGGRYTVTKDGARLWTRTELEAAEETD
jgi:hypothetical protein